MRSLFINEFIMKKCAFTICAKNYLAQAITLKKSFEKHNDVIDFYIFLSDLTSEIVPSDVILMDDSWIPRWEEMAFKYSVVEFSTSIKPFCFSKLFNEGYDEVMYLDPDIYVTAKLDYIYSLLDRKSIVLSPHYCKMQEYYTGAVTEEELLFVGIYNLGFAAIRNTEKGNLIIDWWKNRLVDKCYLYKWDGLHVDQKWMDFIPCFFPNDVEITHHPGINPAIWNLHERELVIEDGNYRIKFVDDEKTYPLLFFHFSGFDPYNKLVINRRHPKFNSDCFPSYKPLIDEYVNEEYKNGYDDFSKCKYSFDTFTNGEKILPLNRRLYRRLYNGYLSNFFSVDGELYKIFSRNNLCSGVKSLSVKSAFSPEEKLRAGKFQRFIILFLKLVKKCLGVRYYGAFLHYMQDISRFDKQDFLVKK